MTEPVEPKESLTAIEIEVCTRCRGVGSHLSLSKDRKAVFITPCERCGGTGATAKLANQ
jgi:Zn-finger nucleic acid-binding protein